LPDFSWSKIPKGGKIYQITTKYTKRGKNIPNGHKIFPIDQIVIKYTKIFLARPSKIYPNWDFWCENKPSGNPALQECFAVNLFSMFWAAFFARFH
jgi:hypothetical protein